MDCCIVVAAYAESVLGEYLTLCEVGFCALLVDNVKEHAILCLARNDNNVVEVLGSGTDERDTTYIYLLDDVGFACAACYSLLERIEVYNHEIDLRNCIFSHLLTVTLIVATGKDAAEDARMQCLDTSAED